MCGGFHFAYGDWEFVALQCIHRLMGMGAECGSEWELGEIPANDRRNDGEEKMDNCCRLAGRAEKDGSSPTTCGDDGKGGMTANEQLL